MPWPFHCGPWHNKIQNEYLSVEGSVYKNNLGDNFFRISVESKSSHPFMKSKHLSSELSFHTNGPYTCINT